MVGAVRSDRSDRGSAQRKLDAAQEAFSTRHAEERAIDKAFRKVRASPPLRYRSTESLTCAEQEFADAGRDLPTLQTLWKRRAKGPADTRESLDPYLQGDIAEPSAATDVRPALGGGPWTDAVRTQVLADTALDEVADRPEGLPEDVWQRFVARRTERIVLEATVSRLRMAQDDLAAYHARVAATDAANQQALSDTLVQVRELRDHVAADTVDADCAVRLKQGQVRRRCEWQHAEAQVWWA
jgi:hypothetical protein